MNKSPNYKGDKFRCPHCQVISQQKWFDSKTSGETISSIIQHIYFDYRTGISDYQQTAIASFLKSLESGFYRRLQAFFPSKISIATCASCGDLSLWVEQKMVHPRHISLPHPNQDMDDEIKGLYIEAANIFTDSPKGATALLRLALQKLLKQIGKDGKNINNDIKELVSEGLSPKIQQALDLLRVVGNNAVHPGQINIEDNSEIAMKLFGILNFIAEELISKPKELENLYSGIIPEETQNHIKQRDGA